MFSFKKKKRTYSTSSEIVNAILESCVWKLGSSNKYVMRVGKSTFSLVGTNNATYLYLNNELLVSSWPDMQLAQHKEEAKEAIHRFLTQFTHEIDQKPV